MQFLQLTILNLAGLVAWMVLASWDSLEVNTELCKDNCMLYCMNNKSSSCLYLLLHVYLYIKSRQLHSCVCHIPVCVEFLSDWVHLVQLSAKTRDVTYLC